MLQAGLKLTMQPRMAFIELAPLPLDAGVTGVCQGVTGMCHDIWCMQCWGQARASCPLGRFYQLSHTPSLLSRFSDLYHSVKAARERLPGGRTWAHPDHLIPTSRAPRAKVGFDISKASQGAQRTYKVTDLGSFGSLPSLQKDLWPPLLGLTTIKRNKGGRKAAEFPWRPCPAGMKSRIRYRGKMYALSPTSCGDHSRIKVILSSKSSQGGKKKNRKHTFMLDI